MKFFGLIPARGGSKGIPNKNIIKINNKRLIEYTYESVSNTLLEESTYLSSDSDDILKTAEGTRIKTIKRSDKLASDHAKTVDVVIDFISNNSEITQDDFIVLLQPTSPLRTSQHIDDAITLISNKFEDCLISGYEYHGVLPQYMYFDHNKTGTACIQNVNDTRRQDSPKVFVRNGAIYICKVAFILANKTLVSKNPTLFYMNKKDSINIDSYKDLESFKKYIN